MKVELRDPNIIMKLSRLGSFHQSKLSFLRSFLNEFKDWEYSRDLFNLDKNGYGEVVYSFRKEKRIYSLVCFANEIKDEERSDRVIATKWDAAFTLHDGVPSKKDIDRLKNEVPKQEVGRLSFKELTLSRANKSIRLFNHVIEKLSEKPIAITHANPSFWHPAKRNKSSDLLKILSDSGGILGLSLYPHHLKNNTNCTLESFCEMVAKTAEIMNIKQIGIGSDLCLKQPDSIVEWMRNGTWSISKNYGEGSKKKSGFPKQPEWFEDARGFSNIEKGLKKIGFSDEETNGILGNNWYSFYKSI